MGEKASAIADELALTLTRRDLGLSERVLMIGIPVHTIDDYTNKLIEMSYSVVVADAETITEYNLAETELSAENEIDGYAIPDEPESYGRNHDNAAGQLSLFSSREPAPSAADSVQDGQEASTPAARTRTPNDLPHRNYRAFSRLFPQIVDGTYRYLRLESEGFEPLSVERLGGKQYSIMHTFVQNGDLMRDPDMVIEIDPDEQTVQALSYELSGMGVYQDVYADGNLNARLQRELNSFLSDRLRSIGGQGYMPARATSLVNGEDIEITFDGRGNPLTAPGQDIPDEKERAMM
jgi:hypothetical protein